MKIFQNCVCTIEDCLWDTLIEGGLAKANISGGELAAELKRYKRNCVSIDTTDRYAGRILRQYRLAILTSFFRDYPAASWLTDWRIIASAVATYTKDANGYWLPTRQAIVDASQKIALFTIKRFRSVYYNPHSGYLTWNEFGKRYRKKVLPASKRFNGVTEDCNCLLIN